MVKEIIVENKKYYFCPICKLAYVENEKTYAERCQTWCEQHDSCNIEITNHSMKKTIDKLIEEP